MAAKILSYALNVDFNCHLGDYAFGHGTTTSTDLKQQVGEFVSYLNEAYDGLPQFRCVGNHDTGQYNTAENGSVNTALIGKEYLFDTIGKYCEGATYGSTEYGYCYRDFTDKKLRVICLNSSEGETLYGSATSYAMSPAQMKWFAQTLYDVGSRSDASSWSVIVLSHFPLDFSAYGMYNATPIVKAYVEGTSTTQNGTTFNYSGHNGAKFVAAFHGHVHCFSTSKLHTVANNTGTKFDAWRVAVPNSGHYRQNQYADVTTYGINWGETTSYDKVADTYQDCAFVINVVNPSEQKIYSFCYGAGYDRVIGYSKTVYYTVSNSLTNITSSETAISWEENQPYTATLTPADRYELGNVTVTMGGTDITSSVYSNGVISIPSVTGNIVITANAVKVTSYTNQIPISTDTDGSIYNGKGYKEDSYLSSGNVGTRAGIKLTGFIPVKPQDTVRLKNVGFNVGEDNCRLEGYDSSRKWLHTVKGNNIVTAWTSRVTVENNEVIQIIIPGQNAMADVAYIRLCTGSIGPDSIITVNEVIDDSGDTNPTPNVTNLVKSATTPVTAGNVLSAEIYNGGLGYKNGTRISGLSDSTNADYVATGMIPWAKKSDGTFPVLYIKGATLDTSKPYVRCTIVQTQTATNLAIQMHKAAEDASGWSAIFDIETLGTNYYKLTVKSDAGLSGYTCAFRMSLWGTGDNLIITADEPIE